MSRRRFSKKLLLGAAGVLFAGVGYPLVEAKWCRVGRCGIDVPNLGPAFRGLRVALITDVHHGPWVPLFYVERVVEMTNRLAPDLVCLGGDYVHMDSKYIAPCIQTLGKLKARLGVFAVLGNHDHWEGADQTRVELARRGIVDLTNRGVWLEAGGQRVRLSGVDDLWEGEQDLEAALGDARAGDAVILMSHNPDYAERIRDPRVGLVLSGHTHGGQVVLPFFGAPLVPSKYDQKYLSGLVRNSTNQVFVSRGVGTITPPIRFRCRPEISLITLS